MSIENDLTAGDAPNAKTAHETARRAAKFDEGAEAMQDNDTYSKGLPVIKSAPKRGVPMQATIRSKLDTDPKKLQNISLDEGYLTTDTAWFCLTEYLMGRVNRMEVRLCIDGFLKGRKPTMEREGKSRWVYTFRNEYDQVIEAFVVILTEL